MSSGGGSYWYEEEVLKFVGQVFGQVGEELINAFFVDGVLKHVDDVSFELINEVTALFEPYADSWCAVGAIEMYNDNVR